MIGWVSLVVCLVTMAFGQGRTQEPLRLGDTPIEVPGQAVRIIGGLAADTPFDAVEAGLRSGEGRLSGAVPDFGATWSKGWAYAELENATGQNGVWQIRTPLTAAGELELLLLRPGLPPEPILHASFRQGFDTRPVDSRKLISAPFELAAGERAGLAIGYRPLGFGRLLLTIAPAPETQRWQGTLAQGDIAFFATTGVLILCFAGFCLVIRNRVGVLFAGMLVLNLATVAQMEGHFFRYLWPNAPLFNLNATVPLMLLAAIAGYTTVAVTSPGRFRWWALSGCGLSAVVLALTPVAHPLLTTPLTFALWLGTFIAILLTLPGWTAFSRAQRLVGWAAALFVLVGAAGTIASALSPNAPVWSASDWGLRLCFLVAALGLMTLLLMQVARLYQAHQDAMAAQLVAAQTEAALNAALLVSERDYADATNQAARAQRRLAEASHDLRQPLTALRLLLADPDEDTDTAVQDALAYLDRMAGSFTQPASEEEDSYEVSMVLKAAADMFAEEAAESGMRLELDLGSAETSVPTLVMMRIVSNLTVNAIRHSGGTKVELSLSADTTGAQVAVANDGATLSQAEFQRLLASGVKGDASDGDGLGLGIIAELCAEHGLKLTLDDTKGKGTCVRVHLPRAA